LRTRKGKNVGRKQLLILQVNNAAILRNLFSKMAILLLIFSFSFLNNNSMLSSSFGLPDSSSNALFLANEQIHDEEYVDYGVSTLGTGMFSKGSTIHVNYTVLPQSNSSVKFVFHYAYLDYATWLPMPVNYTLAIGESFSGNFTLNRTINQHTLLFIYDAWAVDGGSNATVHWWYEVLVTGKTPAAGFLVLSGALILLSLGVIIRNKRKVVEKNKHV